MHNIVLGKLEIFQRLSNLPHVANQIFHTLPTTRHRCNLKVWSLAQSRGDGHLSLVTPEKVLSEYNEDFIFFIFFIFL